MGVEFSAFHLAETVHLGLVPVFVHDDVVADSRVSFAPRVELGAFHLADTLKMGLMPVYAYDDVLWVPCEDMFEKFEKFGYVLNINEPEPILKNPFSASITELEAKEAKWPSTWRTATVLSWESCVELKVSWCRIAAPRLEVCEVPDTVSGAYCDVTRDMFGPR